MFTYINMDRSLLKNGGRNAYQMPLGDFETLLNEALRPISRDYDNDYYDDDDNLDQLIYEAVSGAHYDDGIPQFDKVAKDLDKIYMDFENVMVEDILVADNGVPVVRMIIGGDWEIPVQAFLYWDGKALRGYIPTYGNTFNRYCKSAMGSEGEDGEPLNIYGKKYIVQSDDPALLPLLDGRPLPVNDPVAITLTKDTYDSFPTATLEPCREACLEDFCSRVVAKGTLPKEMFNKSLAALKKLSDKVIREEAEYNAQEDAEEVYEPKHTSQEDKEKSNEPEYVSTNCQVKPLWALKPFWNSGNPYFLLAPFCEAQPLDLDELRFVTELMIPATRPCDLLNVGEGSPQLWHAFAYNEDAGDKCGSTKQDWIDEFVGLLNGPTMLTKQFSEIDICILPPNRNKFLEEYKAAKATDGEE